MGYLHHKTYLKTVPSQLVQGQFKLPRYLLLYTPTASRERILNPSLVYHQVQKGCGCMIGSKMPWILEWGWKMVSGHLRLTTTSGPATPESLLHIIWCLLQQLWVPKSSMLCWVWMQQLDIQPEPDNDDIDNNFPGSNVMISRSNIIISLRNSSARISIQFIVLW